MAHAIRLKKRTFVASVTIPGLCKDRIVCVRATDKENAMFVLLEWIDERCDGMKASEIVIW